MNRHFWLVSVLVALTGAGCMVRAQPVVGVSATVTPVEYGTVYATVPPPAPVAEYRPAPPSYGYLWVDGYWDWTGYDWTWTQGYWAPERVGYVYVRPRYVYNSGRWVYQRSYWHGPEGRRDYDWGRPATRGAPPAVAPVVRGTSAATPYYGAPARGAAPGVAPQPAYSPPPQRGGFGQPTVGAPPPGQQLAPPPPRAGFGQPIVGTPTPAPRPMTPVPPRGGFGQPGVGASPLAPQQTPAPSRGGLGQGLGQGQGQGQGAVGTPPAQPAPGGSAPQAPRTGFGMPPSRQVFVQPPRPTQAAPAPAPTPPHPSPAMGASRSLSPQPQPRFNSAPGMGVRPGSPRPPSTAAPSGARPAPAPVQGGAMKRGKAPGH